MRSKKVHLIKKIILYLNFPRFLLHIILFFSSTRRDDIKSDIDRSILHHMVELNSTTGLVYLLTFDKYFRNVFYYRIGYLRYFCMWIAKPFSSFTIGTYTPIGRGLLAIHPFASVINAQSIGVNFTIKNNVTIGRSKDGVPVIKDNVEINVGAIVVGAIVLGNNVIVGAGTVVTKSVPDNCTVVGNPAHIIKINGQKVRQPL